MAEKQPANSILTTAMTYYTKPTSWREICGQILFYSAKLRIILYIKKKKGKKRGDYQLVTDSITKNWRNLGPNRFACMTASMCSETWAKTVCSQVFWFFSRNPVANQVPDPSSTGYRFQSTDLYGDVCMGGPRVEKMSGPRCTLRSDTCQNVF